jgi:hypothetical protein
MKRKLIKNCHMVRPVLMRMNKEVSAIEARKPREPSTVLKRA